MTAFARKAVPIPSPTTLPKKAALILLGICLCLILLEAGMRIGGAAFLFFQESQNLRSLKKHGYRVLCLGESTTADQYPRFLEEELNRRGQGIQFSVIDKGTPSVNTDVILGQLEADLDKYKPDLVVTMMGINDVGRHMPLEVKNSPAFVRWLLSLRVVKLARLLGFHMREKVKQTTDEKRSDSQTQAPLKPSIRPSHDEFNNFDLTGPDELLEDPRNVPSGERALLDEAWKVLSDGDGERAKKKFDEVLVKNPRNAQAYYGLYWACRNGAHACDQEAPLLKIVELKMANDAVYHLLGNAYFRDNKLEQAEMAYKKAELLDGGLGRAALSLATVYMAQRQYAKAEAVLQRCVETTPNNNRCNQGLISLYIATGREQDAEPYRYKLEDVVNGGFTAGAVENYRKLKIILDRRKIKLVCAQYPMLDVSPLKNIFGSKSGVFFVDNEKAFKKAVAGERLHEYFVDMFAGDFGHCTDLGNKLMAEQIATVILNEVLGDEVIHRQIAVL